VKVVAEPLEFSEELPKLLAIVLLLFISIRCTFFNGVQGQKKSYLNEKYKRKRDETRD
jgi:hypothetical protein